MSFTSVLRIEQDVLLLVCIDLKFYKVSGLNLEAILLLANNLPKFFRFVLFKLLAKLESADLDCLFIDYRLFLNVFIP